MNYDPYDNRQLVALRQDPTGRYQRIDEEYEISYEDLEVVALILLACLNVWAWWSG